MRRAERVVFAFRALGKTGQPAALADRANAVAAAGQDLVRVCLMADIPNQPVARRVENIVQRYRQLDDAEAGAEMTAGYRDGVDQFRPQFVRQLPKVFLRQLAQIGRKIDLVEQRRPIGNRACWFCVQYCAPHVRRVITNRAASRKSSALCSNKSRWATAWRIKSSACARARSTPRIETKVALPAAASAPTGFPVSTAEPSTSRRSSAIWKARPKSCA